jgi:hypothetical protein
MTKRYTGGVVSSSLPTVNAAGASGVFLLSQQADYQSRNSWPPFKVEESLRFRSAASAYLNRTPAVAGNRTTFTLSVWVKFGIVGTTNRVLMSSVLDGDNRYQIQISDSTADQLTFQARLSSTEYKYWTSSAVFRDPSAWYHIVFAVDTTQATGSDRIKVYVNGVQQSGSNPTTITQNTPTFFNAALQQNIGNVVSAAYFDGYMSEVNFVDGLALTPSAFGGTDKDGNWSPIAYTGAYGQNGFYLNFSNNASAVTMGSDSSGNGNNWTLNGFNVSTANTTYDIMFDVPEDQAGANNRGNYCTLNPLNNANNGTLGDGNLSIDSNSGSASAQTTAGTMSMKSGKYYFEYTRVQSSNGMYFGIIRDDKFISGGNVGLSAGELGYFVEGSGTLYVDGSTTSSWITAFVQGNTGMVAYDADTGKVWFGRNGTWGGSGDPAAGTNPAATVNSFATYGYTAWVRVIGGGGTPIEKGAVNFGQRPFTYTPPTGFKSLNTFNLPDPAIKQPNKYFDTLLWTGDGNNGRNITGYGFSPEFLWIKKRSGSEDHKLNDIVRGVDKQLMSNRTEPEYTNTDQVRAFLSNGFTTDSSGSTNGSGATYVGWAWKANGTAVTNNVGSISSQVSANTTSGFSVVTYTGNGTNATVGHGMGIAPSMIIVKKRSAIDPWVTYHRSLGVQFYTLLNSTDSSYNNLSNYWGSTAPTSTVFGLGPGYGGNNTNGSTYVAYCFAEIPGYSAFGSYTGNGSTDGPFVHTGFRPRFVLIKRTNATEDWNIWDSSRSPFNLASVMLRPNTSDADDGTVPGIDLLSNGFKWRNTWSGTNASGSTYIYMAFAESPFKYSRAR